MNVIEGTGAIVPEPNWQSLSSACWRLQPRRSIGGSSPRNCATGNYSRRRMAITYVDTAGATQMLSTDVYELRADGLEPSIVLK